MTVAVAHQASSAARELAIREAAVEASMRGTDLVVLHVVESLDLDVADAYQHSLRDEIDAVIAETPAKGVAWELQLATAPDDVAETIMSMAREAGASLLVIGARRRSPVGKALLGSVTQSLVLMSEIPVLVVKADRQRS